jgi:uncharacterized protein YaiE (UPF0345 family)
MSKVAITGNASGTGTFTIASPNSNSDRTLTLPDNSGTVLTSASNLVGVTGVGRVLQVVNAGTSTPVTNNTSTLVTTGLTASITPLFSTSKILIIASVAGILKVTSNTGATLQLYRNAGNVFQFALTGLANNTTASNGGSISTSYLDSPATTSSTSYTVYFASQQNNAGFTVQLNGDTSTITLMEIAA